MHLRDAFPFLKEQTLMVTSLLMITQQFLRFILIIAAVMSGHVVMDDENEMGTCQLVS
jgi:hypothetical protein